MLQISFLIVKPLFPAVDISWTGSEISGIQFRAPSSAEEREMALRRKTQCLQLVGSHVMASEVSGWPLVFFLYHDDGMFEP